MQVQGKIKIIGEVQTFGTDFTKRQLVVITDDQYPQLISYRLFKRQVRFTKTITR